MTSIHLTANTSEMPRHCESSLHDDSDDQLHWSLDACPSSNLAILWQHLGQARHFPVLDPPNEFSVRRRCYSSFRWLDSTCKRACCPFNGRPSYSNYAHSSAMSGLPATILTVTTDKNHELLWGPLYETNPQPYHRGCTTSSAGVRLTYWWWGQGLWSAALLTRHLAPTPRGG
jgi:hypothetical protein